MGCTGLACQMLAHALQYDYVFRRVGAYYRLDRPKKWQEKTANFLRKAGISMKLLQDRILQDGRALSEHVLLVDAFLNHQVDPKLMRAIGEEFARVFQDAGITKVVTIEASGIAPAVMAAETLGIPMVILKKSVSSILHKGILQTEVFSFTKNAKYQLTLKAEFLTKRDKVLLIDDFLANGEAAFGAIRLIEMTGAAVSGVGTVIAKAFQPGLEKLRAAGYRTCALAAIKRMGEGFIDFEEDCFS